MSLSRRQFFGSFAAAGVAAVGMDAAVFERHHQELTHHTFPAPLTTPSAGMIRIAHLTDLHLQSVGDFERRVAQSTNAAKPQLIVLTGDSIDRRNRLDVLATFLDALDPATPKFAILGNWEHQSNVDVPALARVYAARNTRLLVNESVVYRHDGVELLVTGLDDFLAGTPNFARSLEGARATAMHLLLAHCPGHRDALTAGTPGPDAEAMRRFQPQLLLSGHTHGGQVNLGGFCPWRPEGSARYISGWYTDTTPKMYVSRGVGVVDIPVRFGARPEVAFIDWSYAAGQDAGPLSTGHGGSL